MAQNSPFTINFYREPLRNFQEKRLSLQGQVKALANRLRWDSQKKVPTSF